MKARIALIALAMAAAAPAYAADSIVNALSEETGLSVRKVQMIIGNRTPFAEYTRSYDRALAQFKRTLGKERAEQLIAGGTIVLERRLDIRVAALEDGANRNQLP